MKKVTGWFKSNWIFCLVLFSSLILRIPGLFEPCWYGDEAIYLVMGQAWQKGLTLYKDIFDHKPPLIFIMAGLTGNVVLFRLVLLTWNLFTLTAIYQLAKIIFSKSRLAVNLSPILFLVFSTLCEGNIANAEIFFALPNLLAGLLILKQTKNKQTNKWLFLLAGFLFSLGFLFKPPAAAAFAVFGIWYLLKNSKVSIRQRIRSWPVCLSLIGFIFPIGLITGFYFNKGAGEYFLSAVLTTNISYLGSWTTQKHTSTGFLQSFLVQRTLILLIVSSALVVLHKLKKINANSFLINLWFGFNLYAALLSERPYPHYLIQPALPLSFLLINLFYRKKLANKTVSGILLALAFAAYLWVQFWHYPLFPYYKNFLEFGLGYKNKAEYINYFGSNLEFTYETAKYIKLRTKKDEQIFIWGTSPCIYKLTGRLPVSRYITSFHIHDFQARTKTIQKIKKYQPNLILTLETETRSFPQLEGYLASQYVLVKKIGPYKIYHRLHDKK